MTRLSLHAYSATAPTIDQSSILVTWNAWNVRTLEYTDAACNSLADLSMCTCAEDRNSGPEANQLSSQMDELASMWQQLKGEKSSYSTSQAVEHDLPSSECISGMTTPIDAQVEMGSANHLSRDSSASDCRSIDLGNYHQVPKKLCFTSPEMQDCAIAQVELSLKPSINSHLDSLPASMNVYYTYQPAAIWGPIIHIIRCIFDPR